MILAIGSVVIASCIMLLIVGVMRVDLPRTPGFEGIEDSEIAQAYNRISRWPQFKLLRLMIVQRLARYSPIGVLGDVGCGPGYLTLLIAQRHSELQVLGLDAAQEMAKAAEMNAKKLSLSDRVKFRLGDAGDLPLRDGTLDFAVSTLSIHHWSRPSDALNDMYRVLDSGGQLLLFDLRRDCRRFFMWLLRFAQGVVVPGALRRANEPLGSLQASYRLAELNTLLADSPFEKYTIDGGVGWVFVWAMKGLSETACYLAGGRSPRLARDRSGTLLRTCRADDLVHIAG